MQISYQKIDNALAKCRYLFDLLSYLLKIHYIFEMLMRNLSAFYDDDCNKLCSFSFNGSNQNMEKVFAKYLFNEQGFIN